MDGYTKPLLAVSVAAAVLLGGAAAAQARRAGELSHQLSAYSARAVYEGAEMMRGVESNLRKVAVSASGVQIQQYLGDIARQAQGAESAVAALPLESEQVQSVSRAINQMGDYASVLGNRIARGGAINETDAENIDRMISASADIRSGLQSMLEGIGSGEFPADFAFEVSMESGGENAADGAYPSLIYDGPFSDSAQQREFLGVTGTDVSAEEAAQRLREFMGTERVQSVDFLRESNPEIPAYEFSLTCGDMRLSAAVTRRGGHVLYVLPETPVPSAQTDEAQCVVRAEQFLEMNGFGDMQASYYYRNQNVLTVSFAARQGDVVLYPDLVKVQVSLQDGSVIGVECGNYRKNHTLRDLPEAAISREEALGRLSGNLTAQRVQKALIPLEGREYLTYEIAAQDGSGNQFLVYIDALSGQERQIYQLLSDENGTLAE